jgi:hypothetical protein
MQDSRDAAAMTLARARPCGVEDLLEFEATRISINTMK